MTSGHRSRQAHILSIKIVFSFLFMSLNQFFGAQKNCLIETVLLSTNTCVPTAYILVEK